MKVDVAINICILFIITIIFQMSSVDVIHLGMILVECIVGALFIFFMYVCYVYIRFRYFDQDLRTMQVARYHRHGG